MIILIKLKKKYNPEIIYEVMFKMGFYYWNASSDSDYYHHKKGFNIQFRENSTIMISIDEFERLPEWLVKNNIIKLSNAEPSSLIDISNEKKSSSNANNFFYFSTLYGLQPKILVTFLEEFDKIYTSIENEKNNRSELAENTNNVDENYLKVVLDIKIIKEMFINQIQISKNKELKLFEDVSNTFKEDHVKLEAENKVKEINTFFNRTINDIKNVKDIKDYINKYNKIIIKINEDLNNIVKKTVKISSLVYVIDNVTEDDMYDKRDYISKFSIMFI